MATSFVAEKSFNLFGLDNASKFHFSPHYPERATTQVRNKWK